MARSKKQEAAFNPLGWMLTFSDLITLLLTFFVMLLSMKAPEVQKLKAAFGIFSEGGAGSFDMVDQNKLVQMQQLLKSLDKSAPGESSQQLAIRLNLPGSQDPGLAASNLAQATIKREARGVVITLANDLLFAPGRAELSENAGAAIHQVADVLRFGEQPIVVEGHTDDVPILAGASFKDNWELSLARAQSVVKYLVANENIPARRLRVAALSSTRPLVPNIDDKSRAQNRRTEIVLMINQP
ncbi:MAG: flagellar motor protein MotB [Desulfarculaceae bacterium]|jgi:chemotaxis protein MotB